MKRTAIGFCLAAAFGCIATLGAQTSTTPTPAGQPAAAADKARDVTITGCLSKAVDGKYMLTNAMMESPSAATTTGTSTTTTGTTTAATTTGTTTSTTSTSGATSPAATSWMLAGGSDLDKHVGHKIQVTGKTSWDSMDRNRTPASTTGTAGTTAGTTGTSGTTATASTEEQKKEMRAEQPRLDVQSVKMIAPSCS
jgi:hypothetical protein